MRIEKIELIGFKSFADKTAFNLHPGITCIVGPNGCGKSNIVDAFRWVLGEQSAKSLRGEKMEEVIFNGSTLKKPKGMAEVTLVISGLNGPEGGNGDGQNDIISASRRLYRSGESEYMINKSQCRLRDVKDIFLDTGLDFKSYSILEQGRIGEILNSKPHERRFILEEVAGVVKYKVRRAEALSKLESSRNNLVRINDIIAEVKKQISILDRLARKAERYKKLSDELHAIELKMARKDYERIKTAYEQIVNELTLQKEKETVMKTEMTNRENRTQTRRVALLDREKEFEQCQKTFQELEREIAEIERSAAVCKNDIANMADYTQRIALQEEEADVKSHEISEKCEALKMSHENLLKEIDSYQESLRQKAEVLESVEDAVTSREDLLEDKRREIFRVTEELSGLRNEVGKQLTFLEAHERREASNVKDSEDARKILSEIEGSISRVESEIQGINNEVLLRREKKSVLVQELEQSEEKLSSLMSSLAKDREDSASCISRLDSLKEIVYDVPAQELLSSSDTVGLLGALSDVMEVEVLYEQAIERALDEKANTFILESFDDIERAIAVVKEKEIGKTSFIPVNAPAIPFAGSLPDGILGRATDFVKVKEGFNGIVSNLLGTIMITQDLKSAFAVKDTAQQYIIATLDGEIVEPSGAVMAGTAKGIFQRKREIRELQEMVEAKRGVIEKTNSEISLLQSVIHENKEAIKEVEASIVDMEKEMSLSKLMVENHMEDKERANRKLAYLAIEIEEIARETIDLKSSMENGETQMRLTETKKADSEQNILQLQEEIMRKKSELEQCRSDVTDIKLLTASTSERIDAIKNEIEMSHTMLEDLKNRKQALINERESLRSKKTEREAEMSGYEEKLKKMVSKADVLRSDLSRKKEEIDAENEDLLSVEQELRTFRQNISDITSSISGSDVVRAEQKMRMENLSETIRQNYGLDIDAMVLEEVTQEEEDHLLFLKRKIEEIGPVNLGTLDEYEELRDRYEFMVKQQEDLHKSIAELEEAIAKINSTTRKRLREAFEALKTKFGEVFMTLFDGGRAELVLTDEHNILETGIEIVAQPPGKKLQNINLLSGGEKALTALALQFASFLIKPTPMCILDEADAPLDETNTERFTKMLIALSKETQFLLVTHNKTTMNIAQHLYGITMEEAGVSKVISMQLAEV